MHRKLLLITTITCFLALATAAQNAHAMVTPVGVALFPPLQVPMRDSSIVGGRLNLFLGIHQSVYGLDLGGVGNMTDKDYGGVQLAGLFNRNKGHAAIYGAQFAGLTNWNLNGSDIYGIQATLGLNVNFGNRSTLVGLGIGGLGNRSKGMVVGGQIGLYNEAKDVFGFQIGLVNVAQLLHGIQIGLVNINKTGPLPVLPVVNIGF